MLASVCSLATVRCSWTTKLNKESSSTTSSVDKSPKPSSQHDSKSESSSRSTKSWPSQRSRHPWLLELKTARGLQAQLGPHESRQLQAFQPQHAELLLLSLKPRSGHSQAQQGSQAQLGPHESGKLRAFQALHLRRRKLVQKRSRTSMQVWDRRRSSTPTQSHQHTC